MTVFSRNVANSGQICDIVLQKGTNPNRKNNEGWCGLHLAI